MAETSAPRRPSVSLKWLKTPLGLIALTFALVAVFDAHNIPDLARHAAASLLHTLPYIVFAVVTVAYLKASGADATLAEVFKGNELRMIFAAAAFGGLAPFCSCEVIPFVAGLLALGAPLSAVMAFWLSSPLLDPATFFITASALGWPFALGKAVSAVFLGLLGGFTIKMLVNTPALSDPLRAETRSSCGCGPKLGSRKPHWTIWDTPERRTAFGQESLSNGVFLLKWLALAYVLEAVMIEYVPSSAIASLVGGQGILPIATAALIGMPAYLNGFVAPPLLAGLMEQGMSPGAAMAFLTAGAISCVPAMAAVWSLVKPRVFGLYVGIGLAGAVIVGVVFQAVVQGL